MDRREVPENLFSTSFGESNVVMEMGVSPKCVFLEWNFSRKFDLRQAKGACQASNCSQVSFSSYLGCEEDSEGSQFSKFSIIFSCHGDAVLARCVFWS